MLFELLKLDNARKKCPLETHDFTIIIRSGRRGLENFCNSFKLLVQYTQRLSQRPSKTMGASAVVLWRKLGMTRALAQLARRMVRMDEVRILAGVLD